MNVCVCICEMIEREEEDDEKERCRYIWLASDEMTTTKQKIDLHAIYKYSINI